MRLRTTSSSWPKWAGLASVAVLVAAACSSGATGTPPQQVQGATSSSAPVEVVAGSPSSAASAAAASPTASKTLQIAYLSFAVANSYDAPMLAAARAAASAGNAQLTVFDANNDPATQTKQLQDAVASGKYDGIILQPIYGAGLVTGVQAAIAKHVAVGNIDQILGADFTTANSQVDGLSANVVFVPSEMGTKMGELTVKACQASNANPCKVGYIYSVKASGLDGALWTAFNAAIAKGNNIQVVAQGESFYQVALGLKASQDMLTAHRDLNVIVGSDQSITGALQAVTAAKLKGKVQLVGYGGAAVALQGIASGDRFGTVMQAPAAEGQVGVQDLIQAIRSGKPVPGVDILSSFADGGVVTKDNVAGFMTLADWPG
jgi:ribose transport system substrate-binding protein